MYYGRIESGRIEVGRALAHEIGMPSQLRSRCRQRTEPLTETRRIGTRSTRRGAGEGFWLGRTTHWISRHSWTVVLSLACPLGLFNDRSVSSREERFGRVLRGSTSVAVVPFPGEDSSSNRPPNDNIRSRILERPNPDVGECAFLLASARSKPAPWSEI